MTDDIRNLLGGYATGTLSETERAALFQAALHDEALFAALADEQVLKELLEDAGARAAILRATEEPRFSPRNAFLEWLQKPVAKGLVGVGALLVLTIVVQTVRDRPPAAPSNVVLYAPKPVESAEAKKAEAPVGAARGEAPRLTAKAPKTQSRDAQPQAAPALVAPAVPPEPELNRASDGVALVEYKVLEAPLRLEVRPTVAGTLALYADEKLLSSRRIAAFALESIALDAGLTGAVRARFVYGLSRMPSEPGAMPFREAESRAKSAAAAPARVPATLPLLEFEINFPKK